MEPKKIKQDHAKLCKCFALDHIAISPTSARKGLYGSYIISLINLHCGPQTLFHSGITWGVFTIPNIQALPHTT